MAVQVFRFCRLLPSGRRFDWRGRGAIENTAYANVVDATMTSPLEQVTVRVAAKDYEAAKEVLKENV
jgi:hypothetical protein